MRRAAPCWSAWPRPIKRMRKRFPPLSQHRSLAFSYWYPGAPVPMPFVVRNVDADEIHFIQSGEVKFETDAGSLTGERGRLCLPSKIELPTGSRRPKARCAV